MSINLFCCQLRLSIINFAVNHDHQLSINLFFVDNFDCQSSIVVSITIINYQSNFFCCQLRISIISFGVNHDQQLYNCQSRLLIVNQLLFLIDTRFSSHNLELDARFSMHDSNLFFLRFTIHKSRLLALLRSTIFV